MPEIKDTDWAYAAGFVDGEAKGASQSREPSSRRVANTPTQPRSWWSIVTAPSWIGCATLGMAGSSPAPTLVVFLGPVGTGPTQPGLHTSYSSHANRPGSASQALQ